AEIAIEDHQGKHVFILRISLLPSEEAGLPFILKRKQFSIRPAFALIINKSQEQTLPHVDLYLPQSVFSHGQLYMAMSRVQKGSNLK
ncbi:3095_t:CDS:1, partial [Racocetra fulgida]